MPEGVELIGEQTGVREVHFTAFTHPDSGMIYRNSRPFMGSIELPGEYDLQRTDPKRVHDVVSKVEGVQ